VSRRRVVGLGGPLDLSGESGLKSLRWKKDPLRVEPIRPFSHGRGMKIETPRILLACLLLSPGCFSADDPAEFVDPDGSTGEVPDEDPSTDAPDPTSNDDPSSTTSGGDETGTDSSGGDDETGGQDGTSGQDETSGGVEAPSIIEVLPEDGAVGVASDAPLVVRFSKPMDQAATQAAYQSVDIPAARVTFSWNDAGDELTITPNSPLAYAEGSSDATTDPLSYSFTISNTGESEAGIALEMDTDVTFSTLRRLSLSYDQDVSLSGRVRDLGGSTLVAGSYLLGDNSVNDPARGFVSFDVSSLPEGPVTVEAANLHARFNGIIGNPFADLGAVVYQHVAYDSFDDALFDADVLGTADGLFGTANDDEVDRDVTDIAAAVVEDPDAFDDRVQFRFRWVFNESDNDGQSDGVTVIGSDSRLDLQVLVP
jgi:hypothetical protein